jgi:bacillithiol biosynthesis cysteine-adding enzyme BshC
MIEVETTAFGGGSLARAAEVGAVPQEWYVAPAETAAGWADAATAVASDFAGHDWLGALAPAFSASGAAADRLARTAAAGGVVVTTGQQPGLFGGPLYTLSKAISALALADALEPLLGVPVAPVFWAATDDTDYAEASHTVVVHGREVDVLAMDARVTTLPMSRLPLGNVDALYERLARAAGSVLDPAPLRAAHDAYDPAQTVGSAYVTLLRQVLEPLGIAVLDAAHPAVRAAGAPVVRAALRRASDVAAALDARSAAIAAAGYKTQVQIVPNLSLVFKTDGDERKRVPVKQGPHVAEAADASSLGPNVLLRPVMERAILPTVTYVAGPGEYAYFAQVSAVAATLEMAVPRVVPRWSGRIIEPQVREILDRLGVAPDDFRDPHAVESRVARDELPPVVREALAAIRNTVAEQSRRLREQDGASASLHKATGGFEARVQHRIDRLERRYAAAVKREGSVRLHDVAVARASLYPNGIPQERALNAIPFLARYGSIVVDEMRAAAGVHARQLVGATHGAARETAVPHAGRHG